MDSLPSVHVSRDLIYLSPIQKSRRVNTDKGAPYRVDRIALPALPPAPAPSPSFSSRTLRAESIPQLPALPSPPSSKNNSPVISPMGLSPALPPLGTPPDPPFLPILGAGAQESPLSRVRELRIYDAGEEFDFIQKAKVCLRNGEYEESIKWISEALRCDLSDQKRIEILKWRAKANLKASHDELALQDLDIILRMNSEDIWAYNQIAQIYLNRTEYLKTIEYAGMAIRIDPLNGPTRKLRGIAWMNLGRYKEALLDFKIALQIQAFKKDYQILCCLTKYYLRFKKLDSAEKVIGILRENYNLDPQVAILIGDLHRLKGEYAEAINFYRWACANDPNEDLHKWLAKIHFDKREFAKALEHLNQYKNLDQDKAMIAIRTECDKELIQVDI